MSDQPLELTEDEIEARMAERPDLLARFKSGDLTALSELLTVGTGAVVKQTTIRNVA